jgi:FkbM family methyltransferase
VQAWAGRLQTSRPDVPRWKRCLLGSLFVPPFAVLVALLRLRMLLLGPVSVAGRTEDGVSFRCHLPDLIQMYIALFGQWEPDLTAYIRSHLAPGDVFIDVGANIGYYTLLASRLVGEDGRAVAIDASALLLEELRANHQANNAPKTVRIVHRAVSDRSHALTVFAGPRHNVGLATTVPGRGGRAEGTVEAAPLAEMLEDDEIARARLVKIDVEGAEPAVLRGLAGFLARCPENVVIVIELSPTWWEERHLTPHDALRPLLEAGFNVYEIPNSYWPWRYLWPHRVARPHRVRRPLNRRVPRLDLVLSREDADAL